MDTGSQVTCISEQWHERNLETLIKCPMVPTRAITVSGATRGSAVKVTRQLCLRVVVNLRQMDLTFLIIPRLTRDCILGADTLGKLNAVIYVKRGGVLLQTPDGPLYVKCVGTSQSQRMRKLGDSGGVQNEGEGTRMDEVERQQEEKDEPTQMSELSEKTCGAIEDETRGESSITDEEIAAAIK